MLINRQQFDVELPPMRHYATGLCFLDAENAGASESMFEDMAKEHFLKVCFVFWFFFWFLSIKSNQFKRGG